MQDAKVHRRRIRIIIGVIVFLSLLIIGRLFSLQIVNQKFYKEKAERQYLTPVSESFDRGTIYFTKKDGTTVAAATVATGFKLAINPPKIEDAEKTYEALNKVVPIDSDSFLVKAKKKNDPYEEIAERMTSEQSEAIIALNLPGVSIYRQKWRFYPGAELAAKAIGFVSYKENELLGRYGLERYYNDVLSRGQNSFYVNFFAEIFANVQSTLFKNKTTTGDVVTTIEPTVQSQLESTIASVQKKWSSEAVGGLIMDPKTGEIIAMAHVPTFDLNEYGKEKDVSIYANPFSQNVYEMGSIVKPLVMAAALDAQVVTPETTYFDQGFVKIQDRTFSNFDKRGRGKATMQDVLSQSLNTGMVFVEQKLGKEKFKDYILNRYKVGDRTGVDLPSEINGIVSGLKSPNDVNYAAAAFGQGVAVTPLNIVRAYASLANGGHLVVPHLANQINQENGLDKKIDYPVGETILAPETISTITNMLVTVVDKGYHRGLPHYSVAAKTGTAQMAKPDGSGYYDDRNFHSLIGFFPATNPRFVLYLFNNYPKGASFSSQTLADPFFEMVQFMTSYYELTPDR
jgi:cell division protein FtsI (penicillin-binding protein 3)/stage V sporulation protein D (sporulation-specific penicillin-binding protein)